MICFECGITDTDNCEWVEYQSLSGNETGEVTCLKCNIERYMYDIRRSS